MANLFGTAGNPELTEVIAAEWDLSIADRAFIGTHPALVDLSGLFGSATAKSFSIDAGTGTLPAVAEGTNSATVDFTWANLTSTVARHAGGRSIGEMAAIFDATGALRDPQLLVIDALGKFQNTLMSAIVTVGATFTTDIATTGVALTWDKVLEAADTLVQAENDVTSVICVLHPVQWGHIASDLRLAGTKSNAIQDSAEAYNAQLAKSNGYKGTYMGIDIYTSSKVPTANGGTDRRGFMFAKGGVAWNVRALQVKPQTFILGNGVISITVDYNGQNFLSNVYYNTLLGAAKGYDAAGVTITSLA